MISLQRIDSFPKTSPVTFYAIPDNPRVPSVPISRFMSPLLTSSSPFIRSPPPPTPIFPHSCPPNLGFFYAHSSLGHHLGPFSPPGTKMLLRGCTSTPCRGYCSGELAGATSSWSAADWLLAVEMEVENRGRVNGEGLSLLSYLPPHPHPRHPTALHLQSHALLSCWYLERKAWNSCSLEAEAAFSSFGSKALVKSMAWTCLWNGR